MIKTRFAPSPTGDIHLGNLRTAFFNYLQAEHATGIFLLRIEDTDKTRSSEEHIHSLIADFNWLNISWKEGYEIGGEYGPYCQSERACIYEKYYNQLILQQKAYYCFCSEEQLLISKKIQRGQGLPPKYAGTCRHLSENSIQAKLAQGIKPVIRFKVPEDSEITYEDKLKGKISFETKLIGDFIIRRNTGAASFMFANAVDDALMGVNLVLRGEDHLTNTPRQLMILQALDLVKPDYGHIPLITGPDGSPLSKRHGSKSVKTLRSLGYTSLAILNYLARLGHTIEKDQLLTLKDLVAHFSLENISNSNARFDDAQLNYWQKQTIQLKSVEEVYKWLPKDILAVIPDEKHEAFSSLVQKNVCLYKEVKSLAVQLFAEVILYEDDEIAILQSTSSEFFQVAIDIIKEQGVDFSAIKAGIQQALSVKGKALFQPLRIALTGKRHGPEMPHIFSLMSKETMLIRMQQAKEISEGKN